MKLVQIKIWLLAIGGAIVSLSLVIFGLRFLFAPNAATTGQLLLLGGICGLSGAFMIAGRGYIPRQHLIGISIILLGVYFLMRANGVIEEALFMRFLGIASLMASALIVGVTYLATKKIS